MPVIIAMLVGGLVQAAGSFVGRALIALGIGYVAYTGIDTALAAFKALAVSNAGGLPASIAGMLGVLKIGTGINIIFSALTARLVLNGLTSGTIKRLVFK
jgi:hypothetical protein